MIMANHSNIHAAGMSPVQNISELTREVIDGMSNLQLTAAIIEAHLPFLRESDHARLPFLDRITLERLIYLARQYCPDAS